MVGLWHFSSDASTLVPNDTNGAADVFVFDTQSNQTERVSVSSQGIEGNDDVDLDAPPSISGDGRYVVFRSRASNFVPGDSDTTAEVFLFDRETKTLEWSRNYRNYNNYGVGAFGAVISADGRYIAYNSDDLDNVPGDTDFAPDIFVQPNERAVGAGAQSVHLLAGEIVSDIEFGLRANPGRIQGVCFDDVISNGVRDGGEAGLACTVYLDANANGRMDAGERVTNSGADGSYEFARLGSRMEYRVAIVVPNG